MTAPKKPSQLREKDLRLAIFRIQRGRANTKATKVNISTVAREAGVSPALIHNHYPTIAETIRIANAGSSRAQRDAKQESLKAEREKNRQLRAETAELREQLTKIASINEMLLAENRILKAQVLDPKIIRLNGRDRK